MHPGKVAKAPGAWERGGEAWTGPSWTGKVGGLKRLWSRCRLVGGCARGEGGEGKPRRRGEEEKRSDGVCLVSGAGELGRGGASWGTWRRCT